jgi:hypothetical protein
MKYIILKCNVNLTEMNRGITKVTSLFYLPLENAGVDNIAIRGKMKEI